MVKEVERSFVAKIQDVVIPYLTNMAKDELRATKKEDYEKTIKYLGLILNRVYPYYHILLFKEIS